MKKNRKLLLEIGIIILLLMSAILMVALYQKSISPIMKIKALKKDRASVDAFVKEAPQFDDLTMLCLRYFG